MAVAHVDVCRPTKTMWTSVVCAATWTHVDVHGLGCSWSHVCIHNLGCNLKPCWCPWVMEMLLWFILIRVACATTWGHSDVRGLVASEDFVWVHDPTVPGHCVRGLCCHYGPCGDAWSMLPLTEDQGGYLCCGINDCRCTGEREGHGRILGQHPLESNSLDRKTLKRTLKKCDGEAAEV